MTYIHCCISPEYALDTLIHQHSKEPCGRQPCYQKTHPHMQRCYMARCGFRHSLCSHQQCSIRVLVTPVAAGDSLCYSHQRYRLLRRHYTANTQVVYSTSIQWDHQMAAPGVVLLLGWWRMCVGLSCSRRLILLCHHVSHTCIGRYWSWHLVDGSVVSSRWMCQWWPDTCTRWSSCISHPAAVHRHDETHWWHLMLGSSDDKGPKHPHELECQNY